MADVLALHPNKLCQASFRMMQQPNGWANEEVDDYKVRPIDHSRSSSHFIEPLTANFVRILVDGRCDESGESRGIYGGNGFVVGDGVFGLVLLIFINVRPSNGSAVAGYLWNSRSCRRQRQIAHVPRTRKREFLRRVWRNNMSRSSYKRLRRVRRGLGGFLLQGSVTQVGNSLINPFADAAPK